MKQNEAQFRTWLLGQLRRLAWKQPSGSGAEAFRKARVGYEYRCCECQALFGPKEVQKEHTECVVPLEGFDNWDGIINRMFCRRGGVQLDSMLTIMCKPCHKAKSKKEAGIRAKYRKTKK